MFPHSIYVDIEVQTCAPSRQFPFADPDRFMVFPYHVFTGFYFYHNEFLVVQCAQSIAKIVFSLLCLKQDETIITGGNDWKK